MGHPRGDDLALWEGARVRWIGERQRRGLSPVPFTPFSILVCGGFEVSPTWGQPQRDHRGDRRGGAWPSRHQTLGIFSDHGQRSAQPWRSADRAWLVATKIDLMRTYVTGDAALVDLLLTERRLETVQVD